MSSWRDRFSQLSGKVRFVVCRLFIHLTGEEVAALLGTFNLAAQEAVEAEGDIGVMGDGLVEICQRLLQHDTYWQSAANEGSVFWDEGEAGDYVTELFTDSAQRYRSAPEFSDTPERANEVLSLPITRNLIVMLTVAYEGEVAELEANLASMDGLRAGLKALINLHYQQKIRAVHIHFCPARLGDTLTSDQVLLNFPELIPL
jgi:hypothetical protein